MLFFYFILMYLFCIALYDIFNNTISAFFLFSVLLVLLVFTVGTSIYLNLKIALRVKMTHKAYLCHKINIYLNID